MEQKVIVNPPEPASQEEIPVLAEETPVVPPQEVQKIEKQIESKLSERLETGEIGQFWDLFQKNLSLLLQQVEVLTARVEQIASLHQDRTAEQAALMQEMERLIKIQLDQIEEEQQKLDNLALIAESLTTIEENLREDLQAAAEENQPEGA